MKRVCSTKYCRNVPPKHRKKCHKCCSKLYREKNPMKYTYNNLKQNAKKRGKEFSLTFEEFKEFCIETSYMSGKGRSATSFHIDRIDETKGYHKDNIQILTNKENVRKFLQYDYDERGVPVNFVFKKSTEIDLNEETDLLF